MRKGVDCKGVEWEEIPISVFMNDLSLMNFGSLTALFPVKIQGEYNGVLWLCACRCGNVVVRRVSSLRNGTTRSCGCERYRQARETKFEKHRKNIGKRFGKLVVLDIVDAPDGLKNNRVYYKCLCDCGQIVIIRSTDVISGKTTSCGCAKKDAQQRRREDLTGRRFGKLVVIEFAYIRNEITYWRCICDCGCETYVRGADLLNGHTSSCGCLTSLGELNIINALNSVNSKYLHNRGYFKDLVSDTGLPLRYDFILFDNKENPIRLIEFDGPQHDKPNDLFGVDEFKKLKRYDAIKNQYALSHNIPLVRIPYSKRTSITLDDLFGDKYLINKGEM